ncbi:secreted protein [Melampsora americana]|nr:secreted protein [Melampsora americana]
MLLLINHFLICVIIQILIGDKLLAQNLPNTPDDIGFPIVKHINKSSSKFKRCDGNSCDHLINRRYNKFKKRECTSQSTRAWGLPTWISTLFRSSVDLDDSCSPNVNAQIQNTDTSTMLSPNTRSTSNSGNVKDESKADQKRWLDAHNKVRATYKVSPLVWNDQITPAAKSEVQTCIYDHSSGPYGENLAAGEPNIESVVSDWVNGPEENLAYNPANPMYSHFTQVIWSSTKSLSCARKSCSPLKDPESLIQPSSPIVFWACEYFPPGNVIGQFAENVKAGPGGVPPK